MAMTNTLSDELLLLPRSLTAENGAKAALMGEFSQALPMACQECEGTGIDTAADGECSDCGGAGQYTLNVNISWDNIKKIYAKAVEHFAANAAAGGERQAALTLLSDLVEYEQSVWGPLALEYQRYVQAHAAIALLRATPPPTKG